MSETSDSAADPADEAVPEPEPAPAPTEPVRLRIVQWAAQALPAVGVLPAPLKRVASFAPQRRARLGGTQILAALADDAVRERIATQIAARGDATELAGRLPGPDDGPAVDLVDADPVDVAAILWLIRPGEWRSAYAAALARHDEAVRTLGLAEEVEERARLEHAVEQLRADLSAQRAAAKEELETARAENTTLRRRLGEARAQARAAREEAEAAVAARERAEATAANATTAAEAEVRRLRRQLDEAATSLQQQRSETRSEREDATVRTRLLLDTVVDAARGLQRELGLPAGAEAAPGQRYEAALAAEGARTTTAAGALGPTSPALLEQLLSMPRARLIVDGYNVTKQTWASASLEVQRMRLVSGMASLVARAGAETTVVFDAASSTTRPVINAPRGVRVAFSPPNVIADDVIRDLVSLEPQGRPVIVVTSDQELARDVRRSGATVMASVALSGLLTR